MMPPMAGRDALVIAAGLALGQMLGALLGKAVTVWMMRRDLRAMLTTAQARQDAAAAEILIELSKHKNLPDMEDDDA